MSGIYIHIPFCKQACHYCNFHFSTSLRKREELLDAIVREVELRADYLDGERVETVYFGGGTPSLLTGDELMRILDTIARRHVIAEGAEITLEANPDDLDANTLRAFAQTPINRLSIGIQSFFDADLRSMNRAHNAEEARNCIREARRIGFHDISIDLIYGSPGTSLDMWRENLDIAFASGIPHLSAYCLTVEKNTALYHFVKQGARPPVDEALAETHFKMLLDTAEKRGFEHYEISNFALPGRYSRHNRSYWQGKKYLGLGPAAHSFNGESRQWNVAHNVKYIESISTGDDGFFEKENLSPADKYNEYVMTALRTQWGIDANMVAEGFKDYFSQKIKGLVAEGLVVERDGSFVLADEAKFLADGLAVELFWG